jgi:cytoskeletal protein CcmA (bactofilin family)
MWGDKKPANPARPASNGPEPSKPSASDYTIPSTASAAPPVEARTMSPIETSYPSASPDRATARLGSSLHFKGEISGNEDLHVDGSVEGLIHLDDRKLVVGASAKVTADVIAREVVVFGNVKGNLQARDRIEIKKDGAVVGDLTTARIMIEDGAYFKGSIEIDKTGDSNDEAKSSFSKATKGTTVTSSSSAS